MALIGQLSEPQNMPSSPTAAPSPGASPKRSPSTHPGGRADEHGRNDLAALVAGRHREHGEEHFERERLRAGMSLHGGGDHVHARAVIIPRAEQHGEQHDGAAAEKDTQVAVRDGFAKRFSALPQRNAVDDAQQRARRRDSDDRSGARSRKRHGRAERERLRRRAERAGKICCRERRGKARQNGGKVKDADACDLHREHRRSERRAEERGEHAAHGRT